MDAVGREHLGRRFGKDVGLDAAVIADRDGLAAALGFDPVGQALGGLPHDVNVHAVGARADHAAQTGRAKLERDGETVLNGGVVIPNAFEFGLEIGIVQVISQPTVIHFFVHEKHLLFSISFSVCRGDNLV